MHIDMEQNQLIKRFSKQKKVVFQIIKENPIHPSANWIYQKACEEIPNISLGTVYRNLNQLSKEKWIKELIFSAGTSRYDGNIMPHHHIMCTSCGKIEDIDIETDYDINKIEEAISSSLNYNDVCCELLVTGICSECT